MKQFNNNADTNAYNPLSDVVATVPVGAEQRPAGTGCTDRLRRAGQAFAIADACFRNDWPRFGLPVLYAAVSLGLQGLLIYYRQTLPRPLCLITLWDAVAKVSSIGSDAFPRESQEDRLRWIAFSMIGEDYRKVGYYAIEDKEIWQLFARTKQLMDAIATQTGIPF